MATNENKGTDWTYNLDLGFFIPFTCGIGKNQLAAEIAMADAKEKKPKIHKPIEEITQDDLEQAVMGYINEVPFNYKIFDGVLPALKPEDTTELDDYLRAVETLGSNQAAKDAYDQILLYDKHTGVLTKLGFQVRMQEIQELTDESNAWYLYFDGDYMHEANRVFGSAAVDSLLESAGKGLVAITRQDERRKNGRDYPDKDRRHYTRRNSPPVFDIVALPPDEEDDVYDYEVQSLVKRENGKNGDEFIVRVECSDQYIDKIAQKCFSAMYHYENLLHIGK